MTTSNNVYHYNIVNTFEGGMVQDSLNYLQPKGTYRFARNMVKGDRRNLGYGLSTEESTKKITDIGKVVGAYYVESIDGTIFFTMDGSIELFDHETQKVTHVVSDTEFGCDWGFDQCNYISATFKTDQPCNELKVYFSSGCDYYVVNITEMLNEARKEGLKAAITGTNKDKCALNCDYFRIFKCVCQPTITPITSDRGGHKLVNGTYQFVAQLEDNGGNKTNWYTVSDPVSVESENNQPGELSLASIKVHITDLDCRYDKVNIAVIKTVENNNTAQVVATRHYNSQGITFTYVGQEGRDISLLEIQAKKKMFLKGNDVAQKDSRLFLYGIRSEKNLNMQQRVLNEAKLSFIEIETTPEMVRRHGLRTYERGENYMFAVVYNYCDGTHSVAFPMKPNGAAGACGGGAGFSGTSIQPASGDGVKVERPRGGPNAEGATYGCSTGKCGAPGTGGSGETETRASSGTTSVENGILEEIQDWQTEIPNLVNAATCDECTEPWCCDDADHPTGGVDCVNCGYGKCEGCTEDEQAIANEVPNIQNIIGSNTDELIYGIQDKDPEYDSYTFKTAAEKLVESVNKAEFVVIKEDDIKVNTKGGSLGSTGNTVGEVAARGSGPTTSSSSSNAVWSDEYTDGNGKYLLDEEPKVVGCFAPEVKLSTELYPDSVDCEGKLYFGALANTPIQLFRTPTADKSPIVVDTSLGVPSEHSNVDPIKAVKVRLLGIQAQVPQPRPEDLPKPLCPNNPWSIVTVARDEINSTVQAKGIMFGTMTGLSGTETYIFGRHACNSRCHMDRWIDNGGSRFGDINGPGVMFYGLDTEIGKVGLSGRKLRTELKVSGIGYRYNLYEKGEEPKEALTGRRVDQRGATQAINLNVVTPQAAELNIAALGYINADQGAQAVSGASHNVVSLHRESSVYIEAPLSMPTDSSFTPDTLNHSAPIPDAYGIYGAVVRDIEDQYGAISGMTFIKTGLEGRGWGVYKGVCGDTFIGPMSFVRKSFVSDKVGNVYPLASKGLERDRTVCDSPNDLTLQNLGIDFYSTQLPLSGDRSDAKNWAGGYEDLPWKPASAIPPIYDRYYPKVQKTLITTWIESRINPWLRATGYGDARETGEVFYPKLKGLHLAASSSKTKHPWEKSFLNRFYFKVEQPSVGQLTRKAIIKNVIAILMPILGLSELNDLTGVPDTVATLLTSPIIIAYWYMLKNLITRNDYLDKMLGLPVCKTDAAGGESDNGIENFENNYYAYNYDHSALNYANVYPAIPTNYNTCSCDLCLFEGTEVVMADSSKRKIKDIKVGDKVASYDFSKKEYVIKPVKRVINTGEQKVFKIKVSNKTSILATANHKWFVRKNKSKDVLVVTTLDLIDNLKSNEARGYNYDKFRIACAGNYVSFNDDNTSDFITEEEAYILGIYIAEGHMYGNGIFISQYKQHVSNKIRNTLEKTDFKWKEYSNGFYVSYLFAQHDLFMSSGRGAENKRIPTEMFTQPLPILKALRDGLMDGDGSVAKPTESNNATREFFYSCSNQLESDFRYLSFLVGKHGITYSNIRSGFGSDRLQHTVHCHENSKSYTGFMGIDSIEEAEVVPTYDIEVEDTHAFILADSGVITHNCEDKDNTNEIYYSNKQIQGSPIDFYKQFGALSFESLPADLGRLTKLFTVSGKFFAQTTDFTIPLEFRDISQGALTMGNSALGGYLTIANPDNPLFEGVTEGLLGNIDPNAGINTPMGYMFIDRQARKIYLFDGSGAPTALSSIGLDRFFKEHLDFCELGECHDEKKQDSTYYSLGYDPLLDRVLVTKKALGDKESFTISLDLSSPKPAWVSLHDYIPQLYFWDRKNMYAVKDETIHLHNAGDGTYRTFYDKEYPSQVEFVALQDGISSFVYKETFINTEAEKDQRKNLDDTFNKIAAYNTTQGTGTTTFVVHGDNKNSDENMSKLIVEGKAKRLNKVRRGFRTNEIKDNTKKSCKEEPMTLRESCNIVEEINEQMFDCTPHAKQNFNNAVMIDDHLTYRMTYDKDNKTLLKLLNVITSGDKDNQK